jgi:hypothetical protein
MKPGEEVAPIELQRRLVLAFRQQVPECSNVWLPGASVDFTASPTAAL